MHFVRVDAQARRGDLPVHGLVALALAFGADHQRRRAGRVEAHFGVLQAGRGRALDGVGEADAAQFMPFLRVFPSGRKFRPL